MEDFTEGAESCSLSDRVMQMKADSGCRGETGCGWASMEGSMLSLPGSVVLLFTMMVAPRVHVCGAA